MQSNLPVDSPHSGSQTQHTVEQTHNVQDDTGVQGDMTAQAPPLDTTLHQVADKALGNMRNTAYVLSEMLEHAVCEVRRLQKQDEAALGRCFENKEELNKSYDTKSMKELTAILKDVVAVEKALCESSAEQEAAAATGVVLLPPVATVQAEAMQEA
ncbi:MAG: hypothetical protein R3Y06_00955 [Faecalibacterium sp.]